jgi:hypothetical protein
VEHILHRRSGQGGRKVDVRLDRHLVVVHLDGVITDLEATDPVGDHHSRHHRLLNRAAPGKAELPADGAVGLRHPTESESSTRNPQPSSRPGRARRDPHVRRAPGRRLASLRPAELRHSCTT